ncbi:hypothetical protein PACID_28180 [Acidipropionibacterium acidipropionici ATCC 4875]|uniref:Uncharacterized protein n=1 Tax=Acidipropionibacterium acidipropionici (strain ATCC 4875 / DSM 20272 / JCM 6432 / NBRC 12425 / NCIMB 8070 / 4) TaxID=1171373 RepID=K7SN02_ACIA4|nr:hypothetical protein PACID_28180 [Acidipropionibacterium acidipropionici ATCC 4875]
MPDWVVARAEALVPSLTGAAFCVAADLFPGRRLIYPILSRAPKADDPAGGCTNH